MNWLAARIRVRYAMVLLAPIPLLYVAFGYLWLGQHQLQADFTGYYTAATIVFRGLGTHLYDLALQRQVQAELIYPFHFDVGGVLPYQYPPFALFPVYPLVTVPLGQAYYLWAAINLVSYAASLLVLSITCPGVRSHPGLLRLLWLAAFSFLPFLAALLLGQLSFLVLLSFSCGFSFFRRGRDTCAGVCLAGVALKPQLLLVIPLVLILKRRWSSLLGLCLGLSALAGMSTALIGPFDLTQFVATNRETSGWLPLTFNLSWLGLFSGLLAPWPAMILPATAVADGASLLLLWRAWQGPWQRDAPRFPLQLALLVMVSLAVSPHVYVHDLLLMVPVAFYVAEYECRRVDRARGSAGWLAAALFLAAMADGYPLFELPVRPLFLMMVVVGVSILAALTVSGPLRRPHLHGPVDDVG